MKKQLTKRAQNVLKALIREHVRTGRPVGSRRLSKIYREGVSAATLRNVMADLEELGYVSQPHPSAGRIPTAEGYRLYVRSLLERRRLPSEEMAQIKQSLENESDPGQLMNKTSQLLSDLSHTVGFVLSPPLSLNVMKHIEFLSLGQDRILVILVTETGFVQHRLVQIEEKLSQVELDRAGRYLTENFAGRSLTEIRADLVRLLSEEKARYNRLLKNVMLLGFSSLQDQQTDPESSKVYLGGAGQLMQHSEGIGVGDLAALFQALEERSRLVRIVTECIRGSQPGPYVTIGLEDHIPGMGNWTLITSPVRQAGGSVGILGPSRMEYDKTISLVDYVAKLFGRILSPN